MCGIVKGLAGEFMRTWWIAILLAALSAPARAEEVQLPVNKDNSIVLVKDEWHLNAGGQDRIRIKGNQHLVAMAFDAAAIKGRVVKSATLVCRRDSAAIRGMTISTIQAPWDEMKSSSLTSGLSGVAGWGTAGAMFPSITGGNSFSLVCQAPTEEAGGVYRWSIDPDLVHACAIGASYGITLHEHDCDYSRNPTIWSREARGKAPYVAVTVGGTEPKPGAAAELKLTDRGDPESLMLSLRAPRNGFAYRIEVNGAPLARWNTPFVRPGELQAIPIRDVGLKGGERVTIRILVVNRIGEESAPASITGTVPKTPAAPDPAVALLPQSAKPAEGIAIIPLLDKYSERGAAVGELPADYGSRNEVFDGRAVRLTAAKGEVVGFQALLTGRGRVKVSCTMGKMRVDVLRAVYVDSAGGRIPDPLVPADEIDLSADVATPVCVDVYVPFDHAAASVDGEFVVSDGRKVPVHLKVRKFAIPREVSFVCEMNSYGLPDKASEYYRLQEVAYDHRVHANILHYSHSTAAPGARKSNMDMVMAAGRRMNEKGYNDIAPGAKRVFWDDFAAVFGPLLTGSCFKAGHRGPVPVPGFYLTFHESWPLNVRSYFNGNLDAYEAFKATPVYAETFRNIVADFVARAAREKWSGAGFQVYLNNKGSPDDKRKNPWILDEPSSYWDYRALKFYGELLREAKGRSCPVRVDFRIDISRPEFDRGELAGTADLWVVGADAFRKYRRLVLDRVEREGLRVWTYASTNRVEESNRATEAWVLETWREGATGLVPWQTVNGDGSALKKADALGLFIYVDGPNGEKIVRHSMRLKAYREGEQLVEYLELARRKLKMTDGQMRAFVDRYVSLGGTAVKSGDEDAGTSRYASLSPEAFRRLREAAAAVIESAP